MKVNFLLESKKSPKNIYRQVSNSFLLFMGEVVVSLVDDDTLMIVGYDVVPPPFVKPIIDFLTSNSLQYKKHNGGITFTLATSEQIAKCIRLIKWTDILVLRVVSKQSLEELKIPEIKRRFLVTDSLKWYEENIDQFHAICSLTADQVLALEIESNIINPKKLLQIVEDVAKKCSLELKNCKIHIFI